jgi:hypothetical protein
VSRPDDDRRDCHDLLGRLRLSGVEPLLFDLCEILVRRLDRLERGTGFPGDDETPTKPNRPSSQTMGAVKKEE